MNVTIVDYNSGNISSVINSFKEVAKDKVSIEFTSDLKKIKLSDKVVLPGQGSFKSCIEALKNINGLTDTLNEFAITNKKPLLGICVGLQMFADIGFEETETKGLGWIPGKVSTRPLMLLSASTQLLNEPWPGKTTLSEDLTLFKSEVTSIFTLSLATSLKEFITELILPEL